jgi:hypothetical protein
MYAMCTPVWACEVHGTSINVCVFLFAVVCTYRGCRAAGYFDPNYLNRRRRRRLGSLWHTDRPLPCLSYVVSDSCYH